MTDATLPALDGIRIVDYAGTIASGYCAKCFADCGAEVIDLEPSEGFATRRLPPYLSSGDESDRSAMHAYLSTNKRSVNRDQLDPKALNRLISDAHLILHDGKEDLPAATTSMTIEWYGPGLYENHIGTDAAMFAMNGMLRVIGPPAGPPYIPTGYQAQFIGGATAFIPALAHVLGCEMGTEEPGERLHTSIFEAMLCFTEPGAVGFYNTGLQASRMGINRFPPTYPLGVFPCADGWLGITVLTPAQWQSFCQLLNMQELADVPLFQTSVGRLEALDIIEPKMRAVLAESSAEDLFYRAQEARVPLARVPTMRELFEIDQFQARHAFSAAKLPQGELTVPSIPFRLFRTPAHFGGKVARLGEHTEQYR